MMSKPMEEFRKETARLSKARGSVKNTDRLAAFARGGQDGEADWGSCEAGKLLAVVVAITKLGGAITIGLSRDLGAHSLTLLLDGSRATLWFNGKADLDKELDQVAGVLAGLE